ncbi:cell wall protein [Streptomyces cyaneofuscatus]|uniref:cell wall protein n=1 Tax=Streptomyces cyaneofuscatus TaxID=66883 RepID=UPI0037B20F4B
MQDILYTASRRAEPRAWLRSTVWLVAAGLHPEAGPSTLVVAKDLAARMDYRRGIAIYDRDGIVRRTGLSRATVTRHVRVLRELGALVWLVHGSRQNLAAPGEGYMATATIYGGVIPLVYDDAMGHRLTGMGYEARVCGVTPAGQELAVAAASARSDARHRGKGRTPRSRGTVRHGVPALREREPGPVDNSCSGGREPHSPGSYHRSPDVRVETGCKDTSRERASCQKAPRPSFKVSRNADGGRRTASQTKHGIAIIQQVRPRVSWTQGESLRALEVSLRPLTDAGWDAHMVAVELHSWMLTWRPTQPAAYIRARLAHQSTAEHAAAELDVAEGWDAQEAARALGASRPELVLDVLDGLAAGMAAHSARQAELGLDDLTDTDAAADMAAFLSGGVPV